MKFTIDRFEGDFAVVETESGIIAQFPRVLLPLEAKEGDIISVEINVKETVKKQTDITKKMKELFID